MTADGPAAAQRRAARLLRWYPVTWRARYGAEFTELLLAELADRPRSWQRTADVVRSGLLARLTAVGLTSHRQEPAGQLRAGLATTGGALAAFGILGGAMLAQLTIGWQWGSPQAPATAAGTLVMSVAALIIGLVVVLAGAPVAFFTVVTLARDPARKLAWPAGLLAAGAGSLVIGAHHFQNSWPGTGGTAGHRGLMPAGMAAFSWASTLSVSSYWAHPAQLLRFPAAQQAWMVVSPVAAACLITGAAGLARRLPMPARLLAYLTRLAVAGALGAACFFAGAACWIFGQGSAHAGLFHAGVLDVAGLAVMTLALAAAVRATLSAREAIGRLARPAGG
ncbi:MAG TPA: hypothetical protein VGG35_01490 [Streptosporangiaceae bacterium]|jgi:hypothetical protein